MIEAIRECIPAIHSIEFVQCSDALIVEVGTDHLYVAQELLLEKLDAWLLSATDREMVFDSPRGAVILTAAHCR